MHKQKANSEIKGKNDKGKRHSKSSQTVAQKVLGIKLNETKKNFLRKIKYRKTV